MEAARREYCLDSSQGIFSCLGRKAPLTASHSFTCCAQILGAQSKVADTRSWALKLELSQGKQKAELYEVEVMQSLGHEYKLLKGEKIAAG